MLGDVVLALGLATNPLLQWDIKKIKKTFNHMLKTRLIAPLTNA
jgi:hypothetical protein